jgi:hypothetical protein
LHNQQRFKLFTYKNTNVFYATYKTLSCQGLNDTQASYEAAITENPANAMHASSSRKKRSIGEHTTYWKPGRKHSTQHSRQGLRSTDLPEMTRDH